MISLSVSNLDLYYGAAQALKGVSLEVKPGAITCVLGRNGVGKSSLLRAIMGLQRGNLDWREMVHAKRR